SPRCRRSCRGPVSLRTRGGMGWREQAEAAGALDRLGATVRAEFGEEVAYVRPDRVHRQGQLAGDLRRGQVGREVTQHIRLIGRNLVSFLLFSLPITDPCSIL